MQTRINFISLDAVREV